MLVSEVMLAQTQIIRVVSRFERFMRRYPRPATLAAAPLADVLSEWAGLGYPRRAVALQRAAREIGERHGGEVPPDLEALRALPGVGPYTARAVLAFAYDRPVVPLDTNVARVVARAVASARLTQSQAQSFADAMVGPQGRGRGRARALMDFGARVCRARDPDCGSCPLAPPAPPTQPDGLASTGLCRWRRSASGATEDPASGSFGVSGKQSRYEGSDREGRGRILRAAAQGVIAEDATAAAAGWPADADRAQRAIASLVADGLLEAVPGIGYRIPR